MALLYLRLGERERKKEGERKEGENANNKAN